MNANGPRAFGWRKATWQAVVVNSRSARIASERPFYALHANAYDMLITDPVEPWTNAVHEDVTSSGRRHARILDAGCGTGRHASALIELGHEVTLLDASAELLAIARARCASADSFVGDICEFTVGDRFEVVTCRGVLNDLVTDEERDSALSAFAKALVPGGMVIIDVRAAGESKKRADGRTRRTEAGLPTGARLTFSSTPHWSSGLIDVAERYELVNRAGEPSTHEYMFQMRPWTREELQSRLQQAGFEKIEIRTGVGRMTSDRLLVIARTPLLS